MLFQIQRVIMKDFENIDAVKTGKFIKELRKAHNMKQDELGDKLFISRKSVSKWETGRACPSVDMLKRLSNVLGVTVEDLMAGEFISESEKKDSESKSINIKHFKTIGIFSIVVILFLTFCLYNLSKNNSLAFKVYYEDENFFIDDGILVLDKDDSYLSFGHMKSYIDSVDISDLKCILYLKDTDSLKELMVLKLDKNNRLMEDVRNEIMYHLDDNEIKDLYIKVFYFNEKEEEISFTLNLKIARYPKTIVLGERKNITEFNKDSLIETHSDISEDSSLEVSNFIDVGFLFEMDKNDLKICASNKSIVVDNIIYDLLYEDDGNILRIQSEEDALLIYLDSRRFIFCCTSQYNFAITEDNLIEYKDFFLNYEFIFRIMNKLNKTCSSY